jgi:sortase A
VKSAQRPVLKGPPRLLATITLIGAITFAWGAWIPAKAWLAQRLIERAWDAALTGADAPRPWPWADTTPIARLVIENGRIDPLYVLAGASGQALAFGPAHVSASAAPGTRDNVVLAGHRDTHFAFLEELVPGDVLVLESNDTSLRYAVERVEAVHESRVDLLERTGRAELTLLTCYPFDALVPGGPLRYVVHAREIKFNSPKMPMRIRG